MKEILKLFSNPGLRHFKLVTLLIAVYFLSACEVVENTEGDRSTLCYEYYQVCVSPLLTTDYQSEQACATSGCHLIGVGGGGRLKVETTGNIDSFNSAFGMVDLFNKDNSLLLTMPNNPSHTGGIYSDLASGPGQCYRQIRDWLDTITTEQPADQRPNDPCESPPGAGICVTDASMC